MQIRHVDQQKAVWLESDFCVSGDSYMFVMFMIDTLMFMYLVFVKRISNMSQYLIYIIVCTEQHTGIFVVH